MEEEFPQVTEHDDNSLLCLFVCEVFFLLNQETGPSKESQTVLARERESQKLTVPPSGLSSAWFLKRVDNSKSHIKMPVLKEK